MFVYARQSDMHVAFAWFEGDVRNHKMEVADDRLAEMLLAQLPGDFSRTPFPKAELTKTEYSTPTGDASLAPALDASA